MAATKKVVLFIVEGPTEETALGSVLERCFDSDRVRFDVIHGDITSALSGDKNPRERVLTAVLDEIERDRGYDWKDLKNVVQICDADGAFIPEERIQESETVGLVDGADFILARNVDNIRRRNKEKASAMRALAGIRELTYKRVSVPYAAYFFSRNMEHALHGVPDQLDEEDKIEPSYKFRKRFINDLDGFKTLLRSDGVAVPRDFAGSWAYLAEGVHSLERGSNLHLLFG